MTLSSLMIKADEFLSAKSSVPKMMRHREISRSSISLPWKNPSKTCTAAWSLPRSPSTNTRQPKAS